MGKERVALEHHRRAARRGRLVVHHLVAEHDLAFADRLVAGDHAQRRGLAAAGRPEQAAIGAGLDLQRDMIDRDGAAVELADARELKVCRAAHARCLQLAGDLFSSPVPDRTAPQQIA